MEVEFFYVKLLRSIINRYIELAKPDTSLKEFKEKIKQLLAENIFGNDLNQEAIEIAKFSFVLLPFLIILRTRKILRILNFQRFQTIFTISTFLIKN